MFTNHIYLIYEGHTISFQTFFFVWALLLIVQAWNSSPLRSNLLRMQCTCCTVPTTSGRPHGSPLVWACQWSSSQPLSSPQFSHFCELREWPKVTGSNVWTIGRLSWCPSWSNSLWQWWCCGLVHCWNATEPIWRALAYPDGISSWTPLKPQHSNPNPNPLADQLWCIDFFTPTIPLIIPFLGRWGILILSIQSAYSD